MFMVSAADINKSVKVINQKIINQFETEYQDTKDKVIDEFKTMVQMLKDVLTGKYRGIKLSTIGILAFTVVYIILPSLFPQTILDEAALIMTCIGSLKKEFNRYKAWKLNQI